MSDSRPEGWPEGVTRIGIEDLGRIGIDPDNALFWDGRRVEVRRALVLTGLQRTVAAIVSVFAILGGLGGFATGVNNASQFLCARGVTWLGCPAPIAPVPPPAR